ncbi:hypothetical protein [Bordetella avium]|uniref:hypothetical protein n=1 Tax=Bordetella avium TaxID=521 RepID=UPI0015FE41A6|nr:hypothetical protein [Bordetella avium]
MAAKKVDSSRVPGGFVAIPWDVLDSPAYVALSHPAKALLMEAARQYGRNNNGRLLLSMAYLKARGWTSNDTITRAKRELLDAGFLHETVKGMRPNRAGWYAITWYTLDRIEGYDPGATNTFQRGAYRKNASLTPSRGVGKPPIAPSPGVGSALTAPSPGAIGATFGTLSTPGDGDHLDMPSHAPEKDRRAAKGRRQTSLVNPARPSAHLHQIPD